MVKGYFEGSTWAKSTLRTDQALLEKVLRQTTIAVNARSAHHKICTTYVPINAVVTENTAYYVVCLVDARIQSWNQACTVCCWCNGATLSQQELMSILFSWSTRPGQQLDAFHTRLTFPKATFRNIGGTP